MTGDEQLHCASCGQPIAPGDAFCESCGARVAESGHDRRAHSEIDLDGVAGVTDRGHVHDRNEDAFFVSAPHGRVVMVVCDGVSSSVDAHHAAQTAADVAGRALVGALEYHRGSADPTEEWDPRATISTAITAAQSAVARIAVPERLNVEPSSCTLVAGLWDGETITVGWIGDSRAYWVEAGRAECLTVDDSWAQLQLDAGLMTARTAAADPRAHMITGWLGKDAPSRAPRVWSLQPASRGHLILCSDGLWNYAADPDELATMAPLDSADASPLALAQAFTRAALLAGGHDNVTVAVLDTGSLPDPALEEQ